MTSISCYSSFCVWIFILYCWQFCRSHFSFDELFVLLAIDSAIQANKSDIILIYFYSASHSSVLSIDLLLTFVRSDAFSRSVYLLSIWDEMIKIETRKMTPGHVHLPSYFDCFAASSLSCGLYLPMKNAFKKHRNISSCFEMARVAKYYLGSLTINSIWVLFFCLFETTGKRPTRLIQWIQSVELLYVCGIKTFTPRDFCMNTWWVVGWLEFHFSFAYLVMHCDWTVLFVIPWFIE